MTSETVNRFCLNRAAAFSILCFLIKLTGDKMLVAYSESDLYPKLSSTNFIDEIEDFVEGNKREKNKIKVKGVWYDYYGDKLGSMKKRDLV